MSEIILFHGSSKIITTPEYGVGNKNNDYGLAFYCTENIELAKEWAVTENENGYANRYCLDMKGLNLLDLGSGEYHILNWLSILLENRIFRVNTDAIEARKYILEQFLPAYKDFDLIKGYRADDSYFSFANAFLNNTISLQKLSKVMQLGRLGEQYAIKSQKAFGQLKFMDSIEADREEYFPKKKTRDEHARQAYQAEKSQFGEGVYLIDLIRQEWRNDDERIPRILY